MLMWFRAPSPGLFADATTKLKAGRGRPEPHELSEPSISNVAQEEMKQRRDARERHVSTLAIVGRPNVGKSTLFNRLIGLRRSIVGDEPGITRDRLYGHASWNGHSIRVVDTGGIVPDDKESIPAEVYRQARVALQEADVIVMVVDGRSELASPDMELARILIRSGKPVLLAVNKIDSQKLDATAQDFYRLGIKNVFPVSAEHGNGIGELLDSVLELMPKPAESEATTGPADETPTKHEAPLSETKIAIIGRPNVGKSTLLNQLTGTSRAIVSPIAGTTRDAVDEVVERNDERYRFIDTAGIRRKGKTKLMAEKLSVVMARKHLEAADVALLVIDATEGVAAADATIGGYAHESGRSIVIVVNKWDLVGAGRKDGKPPADQHLFENQLRSALKYLSYAPVLFVSAVSGKNVDRVFATVQRVAQERRKRITTGEMNRFLKSVDFERASSPGYGIRIQYLTQAAVAPPTFVVFTNRPGKLHFSYQRFLENQIRRAFGFEGTPIWIKTRGKEK